MGCSLVRRTISFASRSMLAVVFVLIVVFVFVLTLIVRVVSLIRFALLRHGGLGVMGGFITAALVGVEMRRLGRGLLRHAAVRRFPGKRFDLGAVPGSLAGRCRKWLG